MALDIKAIISTAFLALCKEKPLNKITIADIQQETQISRQTFYNHFKDKQDLIQYIYETRVISGWKYPSVLDTDFHLALISCLESDIQYHSFIKQALMIHGQNCLKDYMYEHSQKFNRAWHQAYSGKDPLPDFLCFASDYHSAAQMYMRIEWIMNDMPIPVQTLAEYIIRMRITSLNLLLLNSNTQSDPYRLAMEKLIANYQIKLQ